MPKMTATECVIVSVNNSLKREYFITSDELVKVFKKETDWKPWNSQLITFFDEVSPWLINEFMNENNLSLDQLSEVYDSLYPVWQGRTFREMRHAAMGNLVQEGSQTT
jgi:hypothetical protein